MELPFQATSLPALMIKISTTSPNLSKLKRYSSFTLDLVSRLLSKNPFERPSIQDIIYHKVIRYSINQLLSFTLLGKEKKKSEEKEDDLKDGCMRFEEEEVGGKLLDPEEADRELERLREERKVNQLRQLRESKEALVPLI